MMFKEYDCFWDGKEIIIVTNPRISGNKPWDSDTHDVIIRYGYIRPRGGNFSFELESCTHEQLSELRYLGNVKTKMWDQLPENIK